MNIYDETDLKSNYLKHFSSYVDISTNTKRNTFYIYDLNKNLNLQEDDLLDISNVTLRYLDFYIDISINISESDETLYDNISSTIPDSQRLQPLIPELNFISNSALLDAYNYNLTSTSDGSINNITINSFEIKYDDDKDFETIITNDICQNNIVTKSMYDIKQEINPSTLKNISSIIKILLQSNKITSKLNFFPKAITIDLSFNLNYKATIQSDDMALNMALDDISQNYYENDFISPHSK